MPEEKRNIPLEVEARIYSLAATMEESIIFLEETSGNRILPIWIGPLEGQAIAIRFSGIVLPRPLTHDLMVSIINSVGCTLEKVVISDIKGNTFFATIYFSCKDGIKFTADARPSDALALSVRIGCPIYVSEKVFASAQVMSKPITEDEVKRFKEELKDLKPKDIFGNLEKKKEFPGGGGEGKKEDK